MQVNIDALKESARKLSALLSDPHPGLATWNAMLADVARDIAEQAGVL